MRKTNGKVASSKVERRQRRKLSIRAKISGTDLKPRVCVSKGNKNLYVQVINDVEGKTLFSARTFGKDKVSTGSNVEAGKLIGKNLASKLKEAKISAVVFDRSGYKYCGVVSAVADSIRESGISL